ncbi:stimulator of interferon genes protein-like [Anneissia japonica]|uniref:stimulator of interferon genes protein-like n=1 Tax=Anneissia japonica TaxID=1529436 RepID=UPI001425B0FD|nr:stimulator of interferon genes protein-like [Anneissia japonica]
MWNWLNNIIQGNPPLEANGFGEIPKKRGILAGVTASIFIVLFIIYYLIEVQSEQPESLKRALHACLNHSAENCKDTPIHKYHCVLALFFTFCGAICGKFIECFCVFTEEFRHVSSRHDNSYWQTFKSCFQAFFTKRSAGAYILMVIMYFMVIDVEVYEHVNLKLYLLSFISSVGVTLITNYAFGFKTLSIVEVSEIHESSNTNVAQGMAWSYFTGYLRIILPKLKETISKDDRWKTEMEAMNLPCKFFAIVPLNCKIPSKLGESPLHEGIEFEDKLPTLLVDRAGVKERPYVHSVYKIQNADGHSYFAICEYVTIIDTLFQMSDSKPVDKKLLKEQCRLLVRYLQELVDDDPNCRRMCKIVTLSVVSAHSASSSSYCHTSEPQWDKRGAALALLSVECNEAMNFDHVINLFADANTQNAVAREDRPLLRDVLIDNIREFEI